MRFELLDMVVLDRDLPDEHLRRGDLGTVVELYPPHGLEVEFLAGTGKTKALLTLAEDDVRPPRDEELMSVRPSDASG